MAEAVLRSVGHPLHVNEIISTIEKRFGAQVKYATLVGNISRLIKRGNVFVKAGKNIFGLKEWDEQREAEALFGQADDEMLRGEHDHGR